MKLEPVKGLLGLNLLNVHGSVYHNSATMSCMLGMRRVYLFNIFSYVILLLSTSVNEM